MHHPTMQQIADAAGVSRMAVSLALRNSPKISAPTSERIRRVAEELGYRPNPLVSALMTQLRHKKEITRPSTLAYVTAYPTETGWRQPGPFEEFHEGALQRALALGYTMEDWWLRQPGLTEQRFSDILYARNIHGVLIAPLPPGSGNITLTWPRFALSTIGFSVTAPALHRSSNDQYCTIRLALDELTRLGYRRIGMAIAAENDERVQHKWSAGMLVHQQQIAPEERVPPLLAKGTFGPQFAEWFTAHRPDAVVSLTGDVVGILAEMGLQVPRDVGFAHLALSSGDREWAGVNQNSELVGVAAIDIIDAQLRRNERGIPKHPRTVLLTGAWTPGPTVREMTAAASPRARRTSKARRGTAAQPA